MLSMYAISRGTNKLNLKTAKKPLISRPIFARLTQIWGPKRFSLILPLLNVAYSCKLSLCAISRKINDPNSRKWRKPHFGPDIGSQDQNLGCIFFFFFFKNLASLVTRYNDQLSPCTISEQN